MIDPKIQQVVEEADGILTVYVAVEVDGKVAKKFTVQGTTNTELKDAMRPYLEKAKKLDEDTASRKTMAQEALDELKTELSITAAIGE